MNHAPQGPATPAGRPADDRLDSWKEIAAHMRRDVKTVQRWEKREGMPVHRHLHDKLGSVYAFKSDLEAWARNRRPTPADGADETVPAEVSPIMERPDESRPLWPWMAMALGAAAMLVAGAWVLWPREAPNPLAPFRFQQLTSFDGVEQAAAISPDGTLVAFLSDRDGAMDVWITQIGTGTFTNLTKGAARDIVNSSVRTVDFAPDGALATFWSRQLDASGQPETSVWGVPVSGGDPRHYLYGVAEFDWSADGARLVYHTSKDGDPTFVRDSADASAPKHVFSAPAGLHSHFHVWSPDGAFIYFVQGTVPDRMDIWRIRPEGGSPERVTHHDAVVSHPVFVDDRTLLYLAGERDGAGPWIYAVDVERRDSRRLSVGVDRYTSLDAARDGRRLVATVMSPKTTLWRLSIGGGLATSTDARRVPLTTGNGSTPRLGNEVLLYVSATVTGDSLWKIEGDRSSELWSAAGIRVVGAPAIARDGRRIAFTVRRQDGRTQLSIVNIDGSGARIVPTSLDLQGAPTWSPDGDSITVGALIDGVPRLYRVPIDGRAPARLVDEHAVDPVWSPAGDVVVFSGPDVGTTFPVKAVTPAGLPSPMPPVTLTRGARHMAFLPDSRTLLVLRGEVRHKNLWSIDLATGRERQLTNFEPGFDVRDFDVSPDGRELVIEQMQEHSDVVLLDMPPD